MRVVCGRTFLAVPCLPFDKLREQAGRAFRGFALTALHSFGTASSPLQSLTGCLQKVFFAKERHLFSNSHAELDSASVDVKHQNRVALIINAFLCSSKAHDSSEPPLSIVKEQPPRPLSWKQPKAGCVKSFNIIEERYCFVNLIGLAVFFENHEVSRKIIQL